VFINMSEVAEVFYVTEGEHGLLPTPKISWTLQRTKYNLLKRIADGTTDIDVLREELGISRTMTYTHIRDVTDQELITETPDGYALT
jgi:hypothetical protein